MFDLGKKHIDNLYDFGKKTSPKTWWSSRQAFSVLKRKIGRRRCERRRLSVAAAWKDVFLLTEEICVVYSLKWQENNDDVSGGPSVRQPSDGRDPQSSVPPMQQTAFSGTRCIAFMILVKAVLYLLDFFHYIYYQSDYLAKPSTSLGPYSLFCWLASLVVLGDGFDSCCSATTYISQTTEILSRWFPSPKWGCCQK